MGNKKRAEGGERYHENGDTALGVVPENDPGNVRGAMYATQARRLGYSRHDHEDAEAEWQAQPQFLARFKLDLPEQTHRYGDDQYVGQDVQA